MLSPMNQPERMDPEENISGEHLGVDLGPFASRQLNEQAARGEGPTTKRELEIGDQIHSFGGLRFVPLEKGRLLVVRAKDYAEDHPVKASAGLIAGAVGVVALGYALAKAREFYVGRSDKKENQSRSSRKKKK